MPGCLLGRSWEQGGIAANPCPLMTLGTLVFLVIVPSKRMGPKKVMKMVKV